MTTPETQSLRSVEDIEDEVIFFFIPKPYMEDSGDMAKIAHITRKIITEDRQHILEVLKEKVSRLYNDQPHSTVDKVLKILQETL